MPRLDTSYPELNSFSFTSMLSIAKPGFRVYGMACRHGACSIGVGNSRLMSNVFMLPAFFHRLWHHPPPSYLVSLCALAPLHRNNVAQLHNGVKSGLSDWRRKQFCSSAATAGVSVEQREPRVMLETRNVVDVLEERGLIESIAGEKLKQACDKSIKVYCGFDPTAESLHLGNLLGIIVLSWFQRCGHAPVAILGGATARVGDPSGKSVERPALDEDSIERNSHGVRGVLLQILLSHQNGEMEKIIPPKIFNNYDWWKEFSLLEFLRDVGKYARVGAMITKESVKRRMASEEGISFTEFTYQLLQGYDFVHLYKQEGISVQIGGSDQWGNITAGIDLIRRLLQKDDAYGLTFPLLLKSDGTKFGKSESGAIWLSPTFLSPYQFYQHVFSTPDSDVIKFMKMLTFLGLDEIKEVEESMGRPDYIPNTAQRRLAEEVTRFVHGEEGLQDALKITEALAPGSTTKLDWKAIEAIAKDVPSCSLPQASVIGPVVDLCVSSGLVPSKAGARRLIKQGGLYMNNCKIEDEKQLVEAADIIDGRMLLLSAGKKNKMVVRLE